MRAICFSLFAGVVAGFGSLCIAAENSSSGTMIGQGSEMRGCWTLVCGRCPKVSPFVTIRLNTLTSVSKQRYLLNGTMNVWELVIDTTGNNTIRIYCIDAGEKAKSVAGSSLRKNVGAAISRNTGLLDGSECVTKAYPESTHAHSVEFRVKSLDTINKIQESLFKAMQSGYGESLCLSADECPQN